MPTLPQIKVNPIKIPRLLQTNGKIILKFVLNRQCITIVKTFKSNDKQFSCSVYITMLGENTGENISLKGGESF